MQTWTWALILILLASSFGLSAAQAWRRQTKRRGEDAWQRLVQHRFPPNRPRMRPTDKDR